MSAVDDANNALASAVGAALGPRKVQGDAGMVEQFSATDIITLANYAAGIAAANTRHRGLRFNKIEPDGTAGRRRHGGLDDEADRWPYGFGS